MQTDKTIISKAVETTLRNRLKTQKLKGKSALKEEAVFLCGAMAVLQIVFGEDKDVLTDYVRPIWIIAPLTGRSVLEKSPISYNAFNADEGLIGLDVSSKTGASHAQK